MGNLIGFCKGSVTFSAKGGDFTAFLDDAKLMQLYIRRLKKKEGVFYGNTRIKNYLPLARLARYRAVRLRIVKKSGVPFFLHRYRKRAGLWIGAVVFLLFLWVMQNYVWQVEVSGNNRLSAEQIIETADRFGLSKGTTIYGTDFKQIGKKIETALSGIAWLSVNRNGSRVVIELHETEKQPEIIDDKTPCNLVAEKDGVITYMEIYQGEKRVKPKETVCKGDLLVAGIVEDQFQQTRILHADGIVMAQTYYQKTFSQPYNVTQKVISDESEQKEYLHLLGIDIPLFLSFGERTDCDRITTEYPFKFWGKTLPIGIKTVELRPYQMINKTYSDEEAKAVLLRQIADYETNSAENVKFISKNLTEKKTDEAYQIKVDYICEEDIAKKEKIIINE